MKCIENRLVDTKVVQFVELSRMIQAEYDAAKKKQAVLDRLDKYCYAAISLATAYSDWNESVFKKKLYGLGSFKMVVNGKECCVNQEAFQTFVAGWNFSNPDREMHCVVITRKGNPAVYVLKESLAKVEKEFREGAVRLVQES